MTPVQYYENYYWTLLQLSLFSMIALCLLFPDELCIPAQSKPVNLPRTAESEWTSFSEEWPIFTMDDLMMDPRPPHVYFYLKSKQLLPELPTLKPLLRSGKCS